MQKNKSMKKIIFVIGLASLMSIGCNSDKRRYELVACPYTRNNITFIGVREIDTYTGDVYMCLDMYKNQDSNWVYEGNPAKMKLK